jgi:hypothetical protein
MTDKPDRIEEAVLSPRRVRQLKIAIAIMTALLVLGVLVLVYGMARQASRIGGRQTISISGIPTPYSKTVDPGQGKLDSVVASDGLIVLRWKGEASDMLLTIDPRDGHELGRIQVPHH